MSVGICRMNAMKRDSFSNVLIILLVCCGLYAIYYSIRLVCLQDNLIEIDHGYRLRGPLPTFENITQVMIITEEESLGGAVSLMNSIAQNSKGQVYFFIATDNATMDHLWSWIEETKLKTLSYEIKGLTKSWIKQRVPGLKDDATAKEVLSYSRLFIPQIFPNLRARVVILEDDSLVLGDISELNKVPLPHRKVGAFAFDCDVVSKQYNYKGNKYGKLMNLMKAPLKSKHIDAQECIFNLGVSIIDVDRWKLENISGEALQLLKLNKKDHFFKDNGPLSPLLVSLYNKTEILNPLWHVRNIGLTSGARYDRAFLNKAHLLHWNGPFKPWRRRSPFSDIWDEYYVPDPTGKFNLPRLKSLHNQGGL